MRKSLMKSWLLLCLVVLFSGAIAACGGNTGQEMLNNQSEVVQEESENSAADQIETKEDKAAFPVTITDGIGQSITLEKAPERIISLIPSNTEILYALGYGNKIVGVTDNDNYPEEVLSKEKVGGMEVNLEKVISLQPDLVVANSYHKDQVVPRLQEANIPVLVISDASSLDQVYESIMLLGRATGTVDQAEEVIGTMKARYQAVVEKAKAIQETDQKKVWVEISPLPELYTTGKGTFMHELLTALNAINVAGDTEGWPMFTQEQVIAANPDVILVAYDFIEDPVKAVKEREAWADVTAIKNDQVYLIDQDLVSRPGPRLMDGLEQMAKLIYPEIFQ